MQQWKLGLPSSRYSLHGSSRKDGQDKSPQEGTYFGGSIIKLGYVSIFQCETVEEETRASSFRVFTPQFSEKDLTKQLASRRCIFLSTQNFKTPSLENQGFSNKSQVSQLRNQVGYLKLVRSKSLIFPFEVLISK